MSNRPRIGVSACLLGQPVRWDAGHKRDAYLVDVFGRFVEWAPVCPEVEAGFPTPRETMRLVRTSARGVGLTITKTEEDVTGRMARYVTTRVAQLARADLSGYVLKKDSPTCGMERVKVYREKGPAERTGRGLFAEALMARLPNLPVEEEGRLVDPRLRENFIERVFAYQRVHALFDSRWSQGDLVAFHTAHKLTLMAHAPTAYTALGRLVAGGRAVPRSELAERYESGFMRALTVVATPARHANVLQHMLGYFKTSIDADARTELLAMIDDYRLGRLPLIVPIAMMTHHVRRQGVSYLQGQVYLQPHPYELSLRNHV